MRPFGGYDPMEDDTSCLSGRQKQEEIFKYLLHIKDEDNPYYLQEIMKKGDRT